MKLVIDTNVFVSAFLSTRGVPARILSMLLNDELKILYDNRIFFEYKDVLSRKEFGFDTKDVVSLLDYVKHNGEFVNANYLNVKFNDESDKKFYEVYKFGKAQYLITGNIKHFPNEATIITPREFMIKECEIS